MEKIWERLLERKEYDQNMLHEKFKIKIKKELLMASFFGKCLKIKILRMGQLKNEGFVLLKGPSKGR